jgi:hypothetical protein
MKVAKHLGSQAQESLMWSAGSPGVSKPSEGKATGFERLWKGEEKHLRRSLEVKALSGRSQEVGNPSRPATRSKEGRLVD